MRAVGACGLQAAGGIPFEALAGDLIGGAIGCAMAGQDEFGKLARLVPAVMAAVLDAGVAVARFKQLASGIPAVGLQSLIEPFFLHQSVHHVPGKAALGAVLVEQARQATGAVVLEVQGQATVDSAAQPSPQVVGQLDAAGRLGAARTSSSGITALGAVQRNVHDLTGAVVLVVLAAAVGVDGGDHAACGIAFEPLALAQGVGDLQQFAKAVVLVVGAVA